MRLAGGTRTYSAHAPSRLNGISAIISSPSLKVVLVEGSMLQTVPTRSWPGIGFGRARVSGQVSSCGVKLVVCTRTRRWVGVERGTSFWVRVRDEGVGLVGLGGVWGRWMLSISLLLVIVTGVLDGLSKPVEIQNYMKFFLRVSVHVFTYICSSICATLWTWRGEPAEKSFT